MAASAPAHRRSIFEEFPARAYLEKYYSSVGPENESMLSAIVDAVSTDDGRSAERVIEIGGGPSLLPLLTLVACRGRPLERIVFTDIAESSLWEVNAWLAQDPSQFDYTPVFDWLGTQTGIDPEQAAHDLRRSNWEIVKFDWRRPVPRDWLSAFDVVSSHFFAEAVTDSSSAVVRFLRSMATVGRPTALVLLSFMRRSTSWSVAEFNFPAVPLDEGSVIPLLEQANLGISEPAIRTVRSEKPIWHSGYEGLFFLSGHMTPNSEMDAGGQPTSPSLKRTLEQTA